MLSVIRKGTVRFVSPLTILLIFLVIFQFWTYLCVIQIVSLNILIVSIINALVFHDVESLSDISHPFCGFTNASNHTTYSCLQVLEFD